MMHWQHQMFKWQRSIDVRCQGIRLRRLVEFRRDDPRKSRSQEGVQAGSRRRERMQVHSVKS